MNGPHTTLPYLPRSDRKQHAYNKLSKDARYVRDLANLLESCSSSSLVVYLDKDMNRAELLKAAWDALSQNKSVIIKDFINTNSFEFTLNDLEEHYNISPHRPVETHGN